MSRVRANKLVNRAGTGAPQLTYGAEIPVGYGLTGAGGINISGVATAGSFSGNLTGNVTGNLTGNATGLTGTPNITVGSITASSATISGNVSIAGTLTYEDVTNVDSVGVITARSGIVVNAGGINAVGVITASSFVGSGTSLTGVATLGKAAAMAIVFGG